MAAGFNPCRRPFITAVALSSLAFTVSARGAEIRWQPVAATGNVICMPGSGDCADSEVILSAGGVTVTLFLEVSGWDTDGGGHPGNSDYFLGAYQGTVDSATYAGPVPGQDLVPVGQPSMGFEGAFQALKVCTGPPFGCGPEQDLLSACYSNADCPAGQLCWERCDFVYFQMDSTCTVSTHHLDYAWSCSSSDGKEDPRDGTRFYGGTLILDVPSGAKGTYNVNFYNDVNFTLFISLPGWLIPGPQLKAGQITIPTGQCCYGIGTPSEGCQDNLTAAECNAMPVPQYAINLNATCATECAATAFPPALPPSPEHQALKHRYLSIDSSTNGLTHVAYRVDLVSMKRCSGDLGRACIVNDDCEATIPKSAVCTQHPDVGTAGPWWVQAPQEEPLGCLPGPCGPTDQFARVDATTYFDVWNLSTLHIGDCEMIPVATYEIRACLPPDGAVCSDPLTVGTIAPPLLFPALRANYGDVAGPVGYITEAFAAPDGIVNVVDISAYLLTHQNYGTANKPQTHPTWVDLHGLGDGSPPQYILGVSDLGQILKAIAMDAWTEDPGNLNPGQCP